MKMKRGIWRVGVVVVLVLFGTHRGYAQAPKYVPGEIIVKLRNINAKFSPKLKSGVLKTEISSLDKLNEKFKVQEMGHVFTGIKEPTTFSYSKQKASYVSVPDLFPIFKVSFPKETDAMQVMNEYKNDPNVEWAEPNYFAYRRATPIDPLYVNQWYLPKIKADLAWDITTGNNNIIVAIVDDGVDLNHEDLGSNIYANMGYDFGSYNDTTCDTANGRDNDPNPGWEWNGSSNERSSHGTFVAGVVGAVGSNNKGVTGVTWTIKILPVKVYSNYWDPIKGCISNAPTTDILDGIYFAADKANIINASLGSSNPCSQAWQTALDYVYSKGVVFVGASGNDNLNIDVCKDTPSSCNHVIAVSATGQNDDRALYSNYGSDVNISAPGGQIESITTDNACPATVLSFQNTNASDDMQGTVPTFNGKYKQASEVGTSFAAPVVAGVAALVLSRFPDLKLKPDDVEALLKATADNIDTQNPAYIGKLGEGRVNAYKAVNPDPPTTPTNVSVASLSSQQVNLSWTASTKGAKTIFDVAGYNVYRCTTSGSCTTKINKSVVTTPSYTDNATNSTSAPANGTKYFYVVTAVDVENLESIASSEVNATPFALPSVPTNLSAAAGNAQVSLSWSASTAGTYTLSGYNVYRSTTSNSYTSANKIATVNVPTTSYTDLNATNGTTYYYVISAVDVQGKESANSNEKSATPFAPPNNPAALTAAATSTQATLSWTAATQGTYTISGYNVYRSATSGSYTTKINTSTVTATTYTDTTVSNNTTYYYVVRAVDAQGNESGNSNEATANIPPAVATLVDPPSKGDGYVTLTWNTVTGATSYNLYMTSQSGVTKTNYATLTDGKTQTGVTSPLAVTGLTNGKTYYFVVTAASASGESDESSEVSATIPPSTVTGVTAAGSEQITVSWNAATGATSYNLYMAAQSGLTKSNYTTLVDGNKFTNVTSPKTISNVINGITYYFVVTAVNAGGESADSNVASKTIPITFPKGASMIALPLSSSSSASSLFSADVEFNFARWDAEKSTYTCAAASSKCNTVSSDMSIAPGNGYWLKLKDEKVFDSLNGTPISASQDYSVTVFPGWNQIANPFTQKCSWEKVKIQYNGTQKTIPEAVEADLNWLGSYAWTYRNQTYQCANYIGNNHTTSCAQTILEPFYGYWVYSGISQGTHATLIFSKDCLTTPPAKPVAEKALAGTVFSVQIKASTETSSDENNVFGVSKTQMDKDALKPPDALGQTLRAYFVSGNKQKAYDFHGGASQKEQVWDFVVECDGTQNVTLSWDVNALPSNTKLFIQDTATGGVTDVSAQKSVSVSVSGQKAFKIKYYKPDVLAENSGGTSLFVSKPFMYPNPDKTGNATFRYLTSPAVVRVKIEVYNLAGKLIETFEGNLNGESKWLFGDRVAAGVYVYRITAYTVDGKESVIGKMVVVR